MKKLLLTALLCTTAFTASAEMQDTAQNTIQIPTLKIESVKPAPVPLPKIMTHSHDVEVKKVFNDLIEVIEREASKTELSSDNYYVNGYETAYFTLQKASLDIYFAMKEAERENRCETTTTRYFADSGYGSLETTAKFLVDAGFINFVSITRDVVSQKHNSEQRNKIESGFAASALSYANSFCSVEQTLRAM